MPSVSVVIPHYGDPTPTHALLGQLDAQMGIDDLEVIVADDASPESFPDTEGAQVVRRGTNGGFGSAVNSGAAVATGELLLILNSDLEIAATFVSELLAAAAPFLPAVVSPRVVDHLGEPAWVARSFPTIRHQTIEWLTPLARFRDRGWWHRGVGHDVHECQGHRVCDWVIGAAMLIPLAEFRAIGGFDERFFMNSEEVDLQRRLRDRGVLSVALAEPTVTHEGGGSSPSPTRRQWLVDSRLEYAAKWDKWGGRGRLQAALLAATGVNLMVNSARQLAGRDIDALDVARSEALLVKGGDA